MKILFGFLWGAITTAAIMALALVPITALPKALFIACVLIAMISPVCVIAGMTQLIAKHWDD